MEIEANLNQKNFKSRGKELTSKSISDSCSFDLPTLKTMK